MRAALTLFTVTGILFCCTAINRLAIWVNMWRLRVTDSPQVWTWPPAYGDAVEEKTADAQFEAVCLTCLFHFPPWAQNTAGTWALQISHHPTLGHIDPINKPLWWTLKVINQNSFVLRSGFDLGHHSIWKLPGIPAVLNISEKCYKCGSTHYNWEKSIQSHQEWSEISFTFAQNKINKYP